MMIALPSSRRAMAGSDCIGASLEWLPGGGQEADVLRRFSVDGVNITAAKSRHLLVQNG